MNRLWPNIRQLNSHNNILVPLFLSITVLLPAQWYARAAFADGSVPFEQLSIARVRQMPRLPEPLIIRNWPEVARQYYDYLLDPNRNLDGKPLVVIDTNRAVFEIPSYVASKPADEAVTCLSAVIGAKLAGLDPQATHGFNYVQAAKSWYDEKYGVYRHSPGQRGQPVIHSGIYGYWAAVQGMMLAGQYPDDPDFVKHARTTAKAFLQIAKGLGCPHQPRFDVLGFNFETNRPDGRPEPMNRLGHSPAVAWILLAGATLTNNDAMADCGNSAMQWHIDHPARYEITHVMGPLTAARLNAEYGKSLDLDRILAAWFGDGEVSRTPWRITVGMRFSGITCDGLDGAYWGGREEGFHAFTMGTLQGPAWLVPVVRYDPRYARDIARYALHVAVSARLLQGYGLDWDHQDHKDWKDRWDPDNLFFYEALTSWDWSSAHEYRPYATGDPIRLGWGVPKVDSGEYLSEKKKWFSRTPHNLSLYMGNHIGFLGGIMRRTDVTGIIRWDCLATDWYHEPAYETFLVYNPYELLKTIEVSVGSKRVDLYDLVSQSFVKRNVVGGTEIDLAPDTAAVIVAVPAGAKRTREKGRSLIDGVVVEWR